MKDAYELDTVVQHDVPLERADSGSDPGDKVLERLGKKPVLKREFGFTSMLGFALTVLCTWEGFLTTFYVGLLNGGPAGLVYGFIIVWIATLSVFTVIAELASIAPTAGGQYYWVSMLAPPSSKKFLSYITGWLTAIAWISATTSGAYLCGTIIQGLVVLNEPSAYIGERWHSTLISWACILFALIFNTVVGRMLPALEGIMLALHILGFFAILIPLVYMAPQGSASEVFTVFLNEGAWPSQGLSFFIGLAGTVYSFVGADCAVHMSEEIKRPSTNVPRCIITSVFVNGSLGFGMLLALLFSAGDLDAALNSATGYPFIEIFAQGVQSPGGATAMSAIVLVLILTATVGFIATASRMVWAFARDNGLPYSKLLNKIEKRTSIPIIATVTVTIIPCLLMLINIGSSTVFNDVISMSINGFYGSYLIPCGLLLWRRCTGAIASPTDSTTIDINLTDPDAPELAWGPWRVPGWLGIINNAIACAWMVLLIFFSFWPASNNPTAEDMNYSVVVTGGVLILSAIWYFVRGNKSFKGPIVEIQVSSAKKARDWREHV